MKFIKVRLGLNDHDGRLNIVQSGVLFWLLRHADPLRGTLRASATSIAANTSSDLHQIQRAIRVLEDEGYMPRLKNRPGQKGLPVYLLVRNFTQDYLFAPVRSGTATHKTISKR